MNYGRGEYKLPSLLPGKKHKEKLGKIGEGANFEITWKYHENKSGKVTYNVYFTDMLPPTKIRLSISNPEIVSLEYQGKLFKPYVKKGT